VSNQAIAPARARARLSVNTTQNLIITGIFILICAALSLIVPKFLTLRNIRYLFIQVAYVVISCSATTLVILSGNLDLSIGGLAAMGGVLYAILARAGIATFEAAALAVLISGTFVGFVNGTFVSRFKMPSFIVTIATMYIARGIAYIGAGGAVITADLPGDFQKIGLFSIGPINAPLFYSILVFLIFLFIQTRTVFAKKTYAIGSNLVTATLSGINVNSVVTTLFVLSGTLAAFNGVFQTSSFGIADCKIFKGLEFDVIIACVLGGTDINGGRGTIFGTLIGALIIGVLSNAMNLMGLAIYHQDVVRGIVLVGAILMHRLISSRIR
jgi:ribose/xylose/arabinose/galactoside ABC-type transport system permease subunit